MTFHDDLGGLVRISPVCCSHCCLALYLRANKKKLRASAERGNVYVVKRNIGVANEGCGQIERKDEIGLETKGRRRLFFAAPGNAFGFMWHIIWRKVDRIGLSQDVDLQIPNKIDFLFLLIEKKQNGKKQLCHSKQVLRCVFCSPSGICFFCFFGCHCFSFPQHSQKLHRNHGLEKKKQNKNQNGPFLSIILK